VEDIIDTGLTLSYLKENLLSRNPRSLKIITLLDKPERRVVDIEPDYCGFCIPDEFVVGYGLDFNEKYRNLPDICILLEFQ
jgi:hypoxanthine phosphoribosyltransferase